MENSTIKYLDLLDKLEKNALESATHDNYFFEKKLLACISVQDRKRLGQYSTPLNIAKFMALWGLNTFATIHSILDPSIGCGTLTQQILNLFLSSPSHSPLIIHGYDIDPLMIRISKLRFNNTPTNFKISFFNEDFLLSPVNQLYDLIIANPPYIKSNKIKNKDNYFHTLESTYTVKLDGTTGLDCLFLLKAIQHLNINGKLVFITPSEFLNSSYGKIIKMLLLKYLHIDAMIYFDINENTFVFEDGMSSALITLATKTTNNLVYKTQLVKILNLLEPDQLLYDLKKNATQYPNYLILKNIKDMDPKEKWIPMFDQLDQPVSLLKEFVTLSQFFEVKRGIATGNNSFFTLTRDEIAYWDIPTRYLTPVLAKATYATPLVFTNEDLLNLINNGKKAFLLDITDEEPLGVDNYLNYGILRGINQKYLTSHRKKWFFVEKREPAAIFVKVFIRGDVQFILNKAKVVNLTCFHGIYPRHGCAIYNQALILFFLTTIGKKLISLQLRHYGGGLKKMEPKDVESILIPDFKFLDQHDLCELDNIFETYVNSKANTDFKKFEAKLYNLYKINSENFDAI